MEQYIELNPHNLADEHICCAITDKKCAEGYQLKKDWLSKEFENGYVFRRLNAKAKVFIEYGPAEKGWAPVDAPNYLLINCFWVSGQYKGKGHAKNLLASAIEDARQQQKHGLVTIVGTQKFNFMSDTKWLLKNGFIDYQRTVSGFSLLVLKIDPDAPSPKFKESVLSGECPDKEGIVAYFSNRCPFAEFYSRISLIETAMKRNIPCKIIKLETMEQAQSAPTPATIFSLFLNGQFVSTDISICMDSRFDRMVSKLKQ